MKDELKDRLETMPKKIFDKEMELLDKVDAYDESLLKEKNIELKTYFEVEAETDPAGKKVFTNDTKRKAETDKRLEVNADYVTLKEQSKIAKREIEVEKLAIAFLKRKLKSARALAELEIS